MSEHLVENEGELEETPPLVKLRAEEEVVLHNGQQKLSEAPVGQEEKATVEEVEGKEEDEAEEKPEIPVSKFDPNVVTVEEGGAFPEQEGEASENDDESISYSPLEYYDPEDSVSDVFEDFDGDMDSDSVGSDYDVSAEDE